MSNSKLVMSIHNTSTFQRPSLFPSWRLLGTQKILWLMVTLKVASLIHFTFLLI